MRSFALLSILTPFVLANWNPKLCSGAGGCQGITWFPNTDYTCPDGTSLTNQQVAQNTLIMDSGDYELAPAGQFPTACARGVKPGEKDILVVHNGTTGHLFWTFISETCREEKPAADCYNANPNPAGNTICQITTKDGKGNCAQVQ